MCVRFPAVTLPMCPVFLLRGPRGLRGVMAVVYGAALKRAATRAVCSAARVLTGTVYCARWEPTAAIVRTNNTRSHRPIVRAPVRASK